MRRVRAGTATGNPTTKEKKETDPMMNQLGINLKVTCPKDAILATLKANRAQHALFVAEARAGYIQKAKAVLGEKLAALLENKPVALKFGLQVPKDFTTVYDTTINMLTAHTGDTVTLSADEYRHLVDDEWNWTREFLAMNAEYSGSTRAWSIGKGLEVE